MARAVPMISKTSAPSDIVCSLSLEDVRPRANVPGRTQNCATGDQCQGAGLARSDSAEPRLIPPRGEGALAVLVPRAAIAIVAVAEFGH